MINPLQTFKHTSAVCIFLLLPVSGERSWAGEVAVDLLAAGPAAWQMYDATRWQVAPGSLTGRTPTLDGAITDPAASAFLVSRQTFGGNVTVDLEVGFSAGRYLGVYLDFDADLQSGIWMATGHPLPENAAGNDVERAYIKTVDESFWVVRATAELPIVPGESIDLRFARRGETYEIRHGDTLIATYRKPGAYPPGRIQLRLTNAQAEVHRLIVTADSVHGT